MNHSFNTKLAEKYGIEEAILIENIAFWIRKNIANKKNCQEGEYWVFNSAKAFGELFPYINPTKINRTLKKLETLNILKTGNFNKISYDRTKWYTIVDEEVKNIYELNMNKDNITFSNMQNGFVNMQNGFSQNDEPIPDINKDINTYKKTTTSLSQNTKLDTPTITYTETLKDSGGSLDLRKQEVRAIKQKLQESNLELLTCKNIMKIVINKNINLERLNAVIDFSLSNNKSPGFIVAALKDGYDLTIKPKNNGSNNRSKLIDKELIKAKEKRESEMKTKEKLIKEKENLDIYFNSLPKEKQSELMHTACSIAKKEYGFVWESMAKTKVKYDLIKKFKEVI